MEKQLYNELKNERIINEKTQQQVADKLGTFRQYICDVEKGHNPRHECTS